MLIFNSTVFYSQLLSYNLPANGEERRENAVFAGKNTMKQ